MPCIRLYDALFLRSCNLPSCSFARFSITQHHEIDSYSYMKGIVEARRKGSIKYKIIK